MERRFFLKSLLGLAGAVAVGAVAGTDAHAMPVAPTGNLDPKVAPEAAMATEKDLTDVQAEKVQYYYYRRPRRVYVRRYYYRPRRRVFFYRRRRWW